MRDTQKIVVHYLDKKLERGHARFFFHAQDRMEMIDIEGNTRQVDLSRVKAIFFVKDFEGDSTYGERKEFRTDSPVFGDRIEITFVDDEMLLGRAMGYRVEEKGFYFKPADPRSNNEVIFVPISALKEVKFGDVEGLST